jgi:hypothetical protein
MWVTMGRWERRWGLKASSSVALFGLVIAGVGAFAQQTQNMPVTDSAAQASPVNASGKGPVVDSANQASPIPPPRTQGVSIATGTAIPIKLKTGIDSGRLENGQSVSGTLDGAVKTSAGSTLSEGTPVSLSVVETVPAGRMSAVGEFSLQLVRVGEEPVFTDTQTFRGQPGHRDLPDSAAQMGTDAGLPAGAKLTFHVMPPPSFDVKKGSDPNAGSVNGVASGSPPPKSSAGTEYQPAAQPPAGNTPAQPANKTPPQ